MAQRYRRLALGVGLSIALVGLVPDGSGQPRPLPQAVPRQVPPPPLNAPKVEDPKFVDAVTLPRNPESKRLIQAARDYIKRKEWQTASECLQRLLESPDDSFVEVQRKDAGGAVQDLEVSVREEANRVLDELGPDGLESYQLQYGQTAEDRFKEAVERADPVILAEVSQRYFHTRAGQEATQLLGTYHLDRGQCLMASLCFDKLLARPDADKLSPKVLFKAALANRRAGNPAAADKLMARVADKLGRNELTLGKSKFGIEQLRRELDRDWGGEALAGLLDWPVFRGNATRTATGVGSTAYLEPRWTASTVRPEFGTASDQSAADWIERHLNVAHDALKDKPIIPAFHPITAQGRLIVRTYDGVAAYVLKSDTDKPGKLDWASTADHGLFQSVRDELGGRRSAVDQWYETYYRANGAGPLGIAFENSVLGCIAHDGKRVYFIDDLGMPPHAAMFEMGNFAGNNQPMQFANEVRYNRLCAADIVGGKLSWTTLGGRSAPAAKTKEPAKDERRPQSATLELQDSFFLGPPLPLGGKLYLLVEKQAELRLICLDPEKLDRGAPELVWMQTLGSANKPLPNDALRRVQASHLAYADGILVCPTNAGAVIGVDLLSHSLVWAYPYRKAAPPPTDDDGNRQRIILQQRGRFMGQAQTGPVGDRWRTSAPCITKGKVVFTAHDGTEVHCLSLRNGQRLWTVPRDEASDLYLAGVYDDRVVIVGKNSVRALNLDTGKELWKRSETGLPSGQGVAAGGTYYLPVAAGADPRSADRRPEICSLDLRTGAILARSKWRRDGSDNPLGSEGESRRDAPGNLLFADGELISQSDRMVCSFPLLKAKQEEIGRYLAKNPASPTGLSERGILHLYNGEVAAGVADLRLALQNQPPPEVRTQARSKLHEGLTALLQADFAAGEPYLEEFAELSVDVRRKALYLELLGKGREKQGRVLDAFAAYEQYGNLAGNKELIKSLDEPSVWARSDVWSRGRIQALLTNAKPGDRALLDAEIARRLDEVRTAADLDGLRKFVGLFGTLSGSGKAARLELVERLLATGDPDELTEAERLLTNQVFSLSARDDDRPASARGLELMTRVCVRRGQYENAVGFYRRLAAEFGEVPLRAGVSGRTLYEDLSTDKRFLPYLDPAAPIWAGPLVSREQAAAFNARDSRLSLEPLNATSPFFERNRLVLDTRRDNSQTTTTLRVLDRATGEERWSVDKLPAITNINDGSGATAVPFAFAFARGHDLILHLSNYVYAFDLPGQRKLWHYNLYGKDTSLDGQSQSLTFDATGAIVANADARVTMIGKVAVAEASYVALQTKDGLVALDPSRPGPSVLWIKNDVSPKATVFGDDRHVFVVDPDAPKRDRPKYLALRSQDGVPVPIPDFGPLFEGKRRIVGGRLLVNEPDNRSFRLYDIATAKDVWNREFAPRSTLVACEAGDLGVIEPGGLFTLCDGATGATRFTSRIDTEHAEKLGGATLLSDRDRYYLLLARATDKSVEWSSPTTGSLRSVRLNGPVYALSKRTAKLEWVCDFLPHQTLLVDQLADLPVLLFASKFDRRNDAGGAMQQGVKVTVVSKQTGKLLYDKDVRQSSQFYALRADPQKGRIELERHDLRLSLLTPEAAGQPEPAPTAPKPRSAVGVFQPVIPAPPAQKNR